MITRLYKKSDFDVEKAQRGIVFLDGLDKLCTNSSRAGDEAAQQQVFKEILKVVQGTNVDVTRLVDSGISLNEAGIDIPDNEETQEETSETIGEFLDTSKMFFVCFGGPPDGFEKAEEKEKDENKILVPSNDSRHHSPGKEKVSKIGNNKNQTEGTKLSSGHYSGDDGSGDDTSYSRKPSLERSKLPEKKEDKKDPGDGPGGGGEKRRDSSDSRYKHKQRDLDDLYDDGYGDDEDFDYEDSIEDEEVKQLNRLLEVCEADLHEANSKFSECQKLWGMKDIKFEFADGALEMMAYQALHQETGENGISNILEKLFMTIKFDIPSLEFGSKVSRIEITENAVMGKERPKYYFPASKRRSSCDSSAFSSGHNSITETRRLSYIAPGSRPSYQRQSSTTSTWSNSSSSSSYRHKNLNLTPISEEAKSIPRFNDFEQDMLDQMEYD